MDNFFTTGRPPNLPHLDNWLLLWRLARAVPPVLPSIFAASFFDGFDIVVIIF